MKAEPVPATSDLMVLICLIGGAVRAAGALELLMPLVAMGAYCPSLGLALRVWVLAEERYAATGPGQELESEDDEDAVRAGWVRPDGAVLLWRHVTRFGLAVVIPIRDATGDCRPVYVMMAAVRRAGALLLDLSSLRIFSPVLGCRITAF